MKVAVLSLFLFSFCVAGAVSANDSETKVLHGLVVNVDDGDTLIASIDHRAVIVELAGIRCPGMDEPGGPGAKRFSQSLVQGKKVSIIPEGRTFAGKVVGRIFIGDQCLNDALISHGMAKLK